MSLRKPTALAALAVAVFGFAASLTASAQIDQCERCRVVWEDCLLHAENQAQSQACDRAYGQCMSPIDCPAPEA
ncbi:hypothetical protein [Lysobacter enzymogenes]|uniref:Lipoprotein n=1 Tax=Lysobacter enzymogenes TaxID=69 RepID=A0A3N2RDC5_LYSEN|nr:hypothetical protein [Lysobacter enzymogenes]ROU05419.1 hypothetical protein D9T17_18530 [Lysobacter enzymogenes]